MCGEAFPGRTCPSGVQLITMNILLASLVILAPFMTLCNAQCYFIPILYNTDTSTGECVDSEGVKHPMDSRWRGGECEDCSCNSDGISCCNLVVTPVLYDKLKCKKVYHREKCSYSVVERKNPEKTCVVSKWIL